MVAGKNCEAFEAAPAEGITKNAGWGHILLYLDSQTSTVQRTIKAVKIEDNATVPPERS